MSLRRPENDPAARLVLASEHLMKIRCCDTRIVGPQERILHEMIRAGSLKTQT